MVDLNGNYLTMCSPHIGIQVITTASSQKKGNENDHQGERTVAMTFNDFDIRHYETEKKPAPNRRMTSKQRESQTLKAFQSWRKSKPVRIE